MSTTKLQVFISSTYEDLKVERQAAVAAILSAGHIPAGMELFTADDQSQWKVIERWIDRCDAFVLLLGSRYGSINRATSLSYVEQEYDYAVGKNKPRIAIVMDSAEVERRRASTDRPSPASLRRYDRFRSKVKERPCSFFTEAKDIDRAIILKFSEWIQDARCQGWVHATEAGGSSNAQDRITQLVSDNDRLRLEIETLRGNEAAERRRLFIELDYIKHLNTKHGIDRDACLDCFRQADSIDDLTVRLRAAAPRKSNCEFLKPEFMTYEFLAMINMARRALEQHNFNRAGQVDASISDTYLGVPIHTKSGGKPETS